MSRLLRSLWVLTLLVALVQAYTTYDDFPDRVASHFGIDGKPDGYSSRGSFFWLWYAVILLMNLMVPAMRWVALKAPAWMINVPNAEYWTADPSRRAHMARVVVELMCGIAATVNLMFVLLFQYMYEVNLKGRAPFSIWLPFVLIPAVVVLALVYPARKLKKPPELPGGRS